MPSTVIAERIGWTRSASVLRLKVAGLRPQYRGVDPTDRTDYKAGELAQCDLWFPPVRIVNAEPKLTPWRRASSIPRRNTSARSRRVDMGRRGRKRRLGIEYEYWTLIAAGIGTVEACRLVGVGRKTGYRWRGGFLRCVSEMTRSQIVTSPLSSANASPHCGVSRCRYVRLLDGSGEHLRRSVANCAATVPRTTSVTTTATSPKAVPASDSSVHVLAGSPPNQAWPPLFRRSCSASGVRSRSRRGCASSTPRRPPGTCTTRPSIKASTAPREG
jgi:hypothetical protein